MEERVVLAALEEMKLHSLKFTMEDIARRLRMSKSSLYKFVASKDELVEKAVALAMAAYDRREAEILAGSGDPDAKVRMLVRVYMDYTRMLSAAVLRDMEVLYPALHARCRTFINEKIETCMELFTAGIEEGLYRAVDLSVLRRSLFAAVTALSDSDFLEEAGLTYSGAIEKLGDILLDGLRR